ncbi:MAG TPA: ABC transporter permease subunit [candidate division Zixibacteria bacterium]|nr:ABC transporter permease subunit [candidate division Zixibacteria bacterium]
MNGTVASITLRQLLSRRRVILLLLLAGVLILVAFVLRISLDDVYLENYAAQVLSLLGVATLMPLVALLFGTGAIGSELEDGTAVFLLAKPISRATIGLTKLVVAAGCSVVLTAVPMLAAGLIAAGHLDPGLAIAFAAASAVGAVIYTALFLALSLVTSRALVIGLGYVLIWEGVLAGLFAGTRTFSVREHTLAIADALTDAPPDVFAAQLDLTTALVVGGVVLVGATLLAIRRLVTIEIAGEAA